MAMKPKDKRQVVVRAPKIANTTFAIIGTAPYVSNMFTAEARRKMKEAMELGSQSGSRKNREPRNFERDYEQSLRWNETKKWHGIPVVAFRSAMVDACRMTDIKMTHAKMSVFVVADGYDMFGDPIVRIRSGKPRVLETTVILANGAPNISVRPQWRDWTANVRLRWDLGQFSKEDVANLLLIAGLQVGVGAGRPFSKKGAGCGWGTFDLKDAA